MGKYIIMIVIVSFLIGIGWLIYEFKKAEPMPDEHEMYKKIKQMNTREHLK